MYAILAAMRRWLPAIQGKKLHIFCDNTAVTHGVRRLLIRGPAMAPLRDIAMLLAIYDISTEVYWLTSTENYLADLLSRFKFDQIADIYP